jgi:hypothetical protein
MAPSLKGLLGCTLMSVVAFSLIGRVAGGTVSTDCPKTFKENCGKAPKTTCTINLTLQGNIVVAQSSDPGAGPGDVFVRDSRKIQWHIAAPSMAGSVIKFPDGTHPFAPGTNTFVGNPTSDVGSTPSQPCPLGESFCCYPYTAKLIGADGTEFMSDPRIIVASGGGGGKTRQK